MLPRAGMFTYAVAYLLGVLYVQQLSDLPDQKLVAAILLSLCFLLLIVQLLSPTWQSSSLHRRYRRASADPVWSTQY